MLHDYLRLGFLSLGLSSIQATKPTGRELLSGFSCTAWRQKIQFYPDSTVRMSCMKLLIQSACKKIYISCKHMHCLLLNAFLGLKNAIPYERMVCYVARQIVGLSKKVKFECVIILKYILKRMEWHISSYRKTE